LNTDFNSHKKGKGRFGGVDPDLHMAEVFQKEVVDKNEKALIYSGIHHAFTHYHQPMYDSGKSDSFMLFDKRLGNIIYQSYPEQAFTIFLHAPWKSKKRRSRKAVKPVHGAIDACMHAFNNRPVGFDVKGTPFGQLISCDSFYSLGYDHFTLDYFCDGYVFLKAYNEFEKVSIAKDFYTKENLKKIKAYYIGKGFPRKKVNNWTRATIEDIISEEGDFMLKNAQRLK
jgi:hypothetical protein